MGHGQAQREPWPENNRETFYTEEDEYSLSGVQLQRQQVDFFPELGLLHPPLYWLEGFFTVFVSHQNLLGMGGVIFYSTNEEEP